MAKLPKKELESRIKECQHLIIPDKVISCLKELLDETNDGMVAFELGREYEKIGNTMKAFQLYDLAEDLFEDPTFKNMAQAALNNLVIEEIVASKKRKKQR
jgi:hypothetical protein